MKLSVFLFTLLYLNVSAYKYRTCKNNKIFCNKDSRPKTCTDKLHPVCAYSKKNCSDPSCAKTLTNPCSACQDPTTLYYKKGKCPGPQISTLPIQKIHLIEKIPCDPKDRPQYCGDYISPVCGYYQGCTGEGCTVSFGNICAACSNSAIESYSLGACEVDQAPSQSFCSSVVLPNTCPQTSDFVCSITEDSCTGLNDCAVSVLNSCTACSNYEVTSYITGECFDLTKPQKIVCDPDHRPETCGTQTEFVCAFYNDGHNATLLSPCYACRDPEVKYYFIGLCAQDSDKTFCAIENFPPLCSPEFFNQSVCAHLRNCTEEPCHYTAGSACTVCAFDDVAYYTNGDCQTPCNPETIEQFCSDKRLQPVCAYAKDCTGDSCGTTMESGCAACSNATIAYFTDRECGQFPPFWR